LEAGLPLERLRVTLFLAGEEAWRQTLDAPLLATFAEALVDAHGTLAGRLAQSDSPAGVLSSVVHGARSALFDEGYSAALPVVERALRAVLLETAQGRLPVADASGPQAAEAWLANRGDPQRLVRRYVAEVFGQWAEHVVARDSARLVTGEPGHTNTDIRRVARDVADEVRRVAAEVSADWQPVDVGSSWQSVVDAVFERGRTLERPQ
jgi:ribosomal protein S12 methylthiotransferase accessory factor YcaO